MELEGLAVTVAEVRQRERGALEVTAHDVEQTALDVAHAFQVGLECCQFAVETLHAEVGILDREGHAQRARVFSIECFAVGL